MSVATSPTTALALTQALICDLLDEVERSIHGTVRPTLLADLGEAIAREDILITSINANRLALQAS